ncbi:serine hydrolase domain-containing protein [Steroidobacter sp.]|uniref:serine hydrolase domain-containing protein n=1 Tax=Steroidobacter sp. TaxID=1978227 RepID=UPI001A5A34B1|nr:serine hydrolase domain-containing protein [Steroidobacter sp.]MBL8270615.1 beta-lactamase family protein [Steroidobacter sp.]
MISRRVVATWSLLVCGVVALPVSAADRFDELRQTVRAHMQKNNVPAVAVAVWRDGKIVWEEGFGWADVENRVPANEHTMFCLASLSKTMTATGLMTLVQAGKIDLDHQANDYLGPDTLTSRVGDPKAVTVRTLANHTSGLHGSDQFFYGPDVARTPPLSETIRRYGILVAPAGERYRYSNLGYGVLGQMIQQVSGKPYDDFMRQNVFLPLGMTRSAVNIPPGLEQHHAIRYDYDRKPIPFYVSAEPASASVYSSAHDLAKFGQFLLKNHRSDQVAILSDASIDAMSSTPIFEGASPVRAAVKEGGYGVGLVVRYQGGYRLIGHTGSTSGVASDFAVAPEANMGVVVLANADGGTGRLRTEIMSKLLPRWRDTPPSPPKQESPFQPTPDLVGTWRGRMQTYEGEQPVQLKVLASGLVQIRIGGQPRFPNRSTVSQDALVNDVKFADGTLSGSSLAQIETGDAKRGPHTTNISFQLRGGMLKGVISANSLFDGFWKFGLPYWTELQREQDT